MSSHTPPQLSTGEVLYLFAVSLPLATAAYLYDFACRTYAAWSEGRLDGKTTKRNLATSSGSLMTLFTLRQLQYIMRQTSGDGVRAFAKKNNLALRSVPLTDADTDGFGPATLHLLALPNEGSSNGSGLTLLYFHGGAFVIPLGNPGPAHTIAQHMGARQLAVLEYSLAPAAKYPTQLAQAVAALRHLVTAKGIAFHNIAVSGDSAGGNITLALLAHLQSPHPRIRPLPVPAGQRLRGALVISARTRNEPTRLSHTENESKDMLSKASMALIAGAWKPVPGEVWAAPDIGDKAFWEGLPVEHVLLAAGADEIYRDDIIHTAEMMGAVNVSECASQKKKSEPIVELIVCPGEVHAQSIVDLGMGIKDGIMANAALRWADELKESA
ncbi:hypothetical protein SEUCBS139899_010038 [Sporothrix eucalyptigena]|uniref:Alpha/beta hydrolase fold-3 domain-containing protein n=1 Tax=Sporothrix eucalyptigena TaxID=1812306 RepID=A0ABP0CMZ3_9PEZI